MPLGAHFCRVCGIEIERAVQAEKLTRKYCLAFPACPAAAAEKNGPADFIGIGIFLALFVMFILIGTLSSDNYATVRNFSNVFFSFSYYGTAVLGMITTARAGGIDFSIPFQMILASVIIAAVYAITGSYSAGLLLGLFVCVGIGFFNGRMIISIKVPAVFTTILTGLLCNVAARIITNGEKIFLEDFNYMEYTTYMLIFIPAAAGAFLLVYFTGLGMPFAKRTAPGDKEKQLYTLSYAASSFFAFLGGIMLLNHLNGAIAINGLNFEMTFIFAFFLAGCCKWFDNRIAPALVILFGCLYIRVFENLLNLINISSYYIFIYELAFIAAAAALDRVYRKNLLSFIKKN